MLKNMTVGSPAKHILIFSLPILLGNLFQQLYNVSDILIVGRLIGVNALAALGATAPIFFMCMMIAFGFTGGLTVITAQRFGAGDEDGVRRSITHCFVASTTLSVMMSILLSVFLKPLLRAMNIPLEIFDEAYRFMIILCAGFVMIVFYNLLAGFIRAVGDSKTPLYFLIFSTILNVIFNIILIYNFHFGVAGSALGTVSAISISVVLCLYWIKRKFPMMHLRKQDWKIDAQFMKQHLWIGVPMALQFSVLSLSMLIIQSVCNAFGKEIIAAFTAALRIEQLATQPLLALGLTMATFAAQNWGAGKLGRIRTGVRFSALLSLIFSLFLALLVRYVGSSMIAVFIKDGDSFIINAGKDYLSISTMFYFFLSMIFVFRNTLQGMGRAFIPLMASLTELIMRAFAAIYLAKILGYVGIFWAGPIAWLGGAVVVTIGYYVTIYHLKVIRDQNYFKNNQRKISLKASINHVNQIPGE